jgi:hypothetical protein
MLIALDREHAMKLKTLSFCTFNLYNLNEPGLPLYKKSKPWSDKEYAAKIAYTADMLSMLPSDVYGFQELWHAKSLAAGLERAGLSGSYTALVPPGHNGKKIVCAAAVRTDLLEGEPQWINGFPASFKLASKGDDAQAPAISVGLKSFSRPVLHFRIRPREDKPPVQVFVCHFKSKAPTVIDEENWFEKPVHGMHRKAIGSAISTIRRTAEACALRQIITEATKNNEDPVVIMGDVNDGLLSNTLNILTDQPNYLMGLSLGGSDIALYAAQTLQQYRSTRDVYYTHVFQNERESLDQILVSEQFYDNSRRRIWSFEGLDVCNDHLNFEEHRALGTNDHGVIRARFKYRPAKSGGADPDTPDT